MKKHNLIFLSICIILLMLVLPIKPLLSENLKPSTEVDKIIEFRDTSLNILVKKTYQLKPTITTINDKKPSKAKLQYVSSNSDIASVSNTGLIQAKSAGTANIICTLADNDKISKSIVVNVILPVEKIVLSDTKLNLELSDLNTSLSTAKLTATVEPENAYIKTYKWKSSNEKILTVDDLGNIKALNAGIATISAISDENNSPKMAKCTVNINQAVNSINIKNTGNTVFIGKPLKLQVELLPKNASNKTIEWLCSDNNLASISANGTITAKDVGEVSITAMASSGAKTEYKVNIKLPPINLKVVAKATCIAKNHVGHRWSKYFSLNDKEFSKATNIKVVQGDKIQVYCEIAENDKNPEYGSFEQEITIDSDIIKNGYNIVQPVYVYENGGRYSGYCAEWLVEINFRR